jgi:hypothetical protein
MTISKETIDVPRLQREIRNGAARSRALKRRLRSTWTEPMEALQGELTALRRRLTQLYMLLAVFRGKFHVQRALRDGAYPGMVWDKRQVHECIAQRMAREFTRGPSVASGPRVTQETGTHG